MFGFSAAASNLLLSTYMLRQRRNNNNNATNRQQEQHVRRQQRRRRRRRLEQEADILPAILPLEIAESVVPVFLSPQRRRRRRRPEGARIPPSSSSSPPLPLPLAAGMNDHQDGEDHDHDEQQLQQDPYLLDREGRLEEFQLYWKDYLEEGVDELLLSQLELNRHCVKYLISQTQSLPVSKRPRKVILNSCKFNPNDGTANLLAKYLSGGGGGGSGSTRCRNIHHNKSTLDATRPVVTSCCGDDDDEYDARTTAAAVLPHLACLRLESAYVGHLPTHTASALLHGLPRAPSLQELQLVDLDLRQQDLALKVAAVMMSPSLRNLELRHCRVHEMSLEQLGQASRYLDQLTLHACNLSDALFSVFCHALVDPIQQVQEAVDPTATTIASEYDNDYDETEEPLLSTLRHLALPSNRLSLASLPTLTFLMEHQPQLETLDVERISRLFGITGTEATTLLPPLPSPAAAPALLLPEHPQQQQQQQQHQELFHVLIRPFCHTVQNHVGLRKMDLSKCGITDQTATELFQALVAAATTTTTTTMNNTINSGLQELLLGGNTDLSLDGKWIGLLPQLTTLRRLDLPKQASGRVPWWRTTSSNMTNTPVMDAEDSSNHNNSNGSNETNNMADKKKNGWMETCLRQNTSLEYLTLDGNSPALIMAVAAVGADPSLSFATAVVVAAASTSTSASTSTLASPLLPGTSSAPALLPFPSDVLRRNQWLHYAQRALATSCRNHAHRRQNHPQQRCYHGRYRRPHDNSHDRDIANVYGDTLFPYVLQRTCQHPQGSTATFTVLTHCLVPWATGTAEQPLQQPFHD